MAYEEYKRIVNNRTKGQIIRGIKYHPTMQLDAKKNLVLSFLSLLYNDEETQILIEKTLKSLGLFNKN